MPTRTRHLAGPCTASALVALAWFSGNGQPGPHATALPHAQTAEHPYSVQLHVHGSYSEGVGSMDSHSFEAQNLGVDAIWWSDHDFRIASYHHVSTYGFEAESEPLDRNEPWTRRHRREADREKQMRIATDRSSARGDVTYTVHPTVEGERSMRVRSSSRTPRFKALLHELTAHRAITHRALATEVTFEVAVFPELLEGEAHGVVEVVLSEHAPHDDIPFTNHILRYLLGSELSEPVREGNVYSIPVACEPGQWNRLTLDVTADARRGFPFTDGGDNTLGRILFGVETRRSGQATVVFDAFRMGQEFLGSAAYASQRTVMAAMEEQYPDLAQLQGLEISYETYHLNEFSLDTPLPDYDQLVKDSGMLGEDGMIRTGTGKAYKAYVTDRLVREAHERGGLISYNHMFGAGRLGNEEDEPRISPEETLELLLANRLFGADILEVGYKVRGGQPLASHLWVWDQLALRGLWPVGDGVSDYHGGLGQNGWRKGLNNFVSWIWSAGLEKADLLEGLRAGRVYFGDPVVYDGSLDLVSDRGFRMGQIVLTDRDSADVRLEVTGLGDTDVVKAIRNGQAAGEQVAADGGRETTCHLTLGASLDEGPAFARFEVFDAADSPKVFSNPLIFVRGPLEHGLTPARAAIDVGDLRSTHIAGFSPTDARRRPDGSVSITGSSVKPGKPEESGGTLVFNTAEFGPASVTFEGLTGTADQEGERLTLSGLEGSGQVLITRAD